MFSRLIDTWGERTKSTMTLVHGDFRAENIFFDEEGQVAAMVDFQVCKEGTAVGDVACVHCQQSLPLVGRKALTHVAHGPLPPRHHQPPACACRCLTLPATTPAPPAASI